MTSSVKTSDDPSPLRPEQPNAPAPERPSPSLELGEALARARVIIGHARVDLAHRGAALGVVEELDRALAAIGATSAPDVASAAVPNALERAQEGRAVAEASEQRLEFVYAATSTLLESPLDAVTRLEKLTTLVVPDLADWCLCDLRAGEGGAVRRIAVRHWNPERAEQARALEREYVLDPKARFGISHVLSSGRAEIVFERIGPLAAETPEELAFEAILAVLGATSYMVVPLEAHGRVLAALTFVFSESSRRYGPTDLVLAEDLARRSALAVDNASLVQRLERAVCVRDEMAIENAHLLRKAEDAVRTRENVLAIVSHDLRNPLGTVLMAAKQIELLADDTQSGMRIKKSAGIIFRGVDRMTRLVSDLLDLAQIEAGQPLPVEVEKCDGTALTLAAVEACEPLANARGLTLKADLVEGPVYVNCDAERVQQVFANLIGNAIKFTREGGSIRVGARRAKGEIVLSVSDTGTGIPEDQVAHIFEPYWQAGTHRKGGIGLGLSIVKAIVDAHGGRIWIESALEKGSSFYFTLPAADAPRAEADKEAEG